MASSKEVETPFLVSLVAGGLAGTSVDVALFPIDTIKTRLQSPQGFIKAGGFNGIYRGLGAAALGSSPGAALFFSVYEFTKPKLISAQQHYGLWENSHSLSHMLAASMGEVAACTVRVPTEVIKTNMQTNFKDSATLTSTVKRVVAEGALYRGFGITLMREIPFAFIQFPIYEHAKATWARRTNRASVSPLEAAACGSFGGGIAAALTTPLDLIKTRLMLGSDKHGVPYKGVVDVVRKVWTNEGTLTFANGIQPRVMWISIGGFVFFGSYETYRSLLMLTGK